MLADIPPGVGRNFADVHLTVGTGVTAGVGHDATRPTPNLPDAHVTVAMGF